MDAFVQDQLFARTIPSKTSFFRSFVEDVTAFHRVCDVPVAPVPTRLDTERVGLRERLLIEEWDETKQAIANGDLVEIADGLVDVIYIVAGTAIECGVSLVPQDEFLASAEFDSVYSSLRVLLFDRLPDVRVTPSHGLVAIMDSLVSLANQAIASDDYAKMTQNLSRVVEVSLLIGTVCNLPVLEVWKEVHRSNMSKADPLTGHVRKREDGKVLKPDGWKRPDVAGVIEMYRRNIDNTSVLNDAAKELSSAYFEACKSISFSIDSDHLGITKRIEIAIRSYLDVMALTVFCYEQFVDDPSRLCVLLGAMEYAVEKMSEAEEAARSNYQSRGESYSYSIMSKSIAALVKLHNLHERMLQE